MKLNQKNLSGLNLYTLRKLGQFFGVKSPTSKRNCVLIEEILQKQDLILATLNDENGIDYNYLVSCDDKELAEIARIYSVKKSRYAKPIDLIAAIESKRLMFVEFFKGDQNIIKNFDFGINTDKNFLRETDDDKELQTTTKFKNILQAAKQCISEVLKLPTEFKEKAKILKHLQEISKAAATDNDDEIYLSALNEILNLN